MEIYETMIPGIGIKYTFNGDHGEFSVVVKPDGSKEVYYNDGENFRVVQLSDDEARVMAMLLFESPLRIVQGRSDLNLGKSILKWITVNEDRNDRIIDIDRNAILFIRKGKIERDLNQVARSGDVILSGE